jgi:hypothetical protein
MAVITDGQLEIGEELVIGSGTDFRLPPSFVQWWAAPTVRTSDADRSSADGAVYGRDLLGKHTVSIIVTILGDSESAMRDRIDEWKHACRVRADSTVLVRANLLGQTRRRYGRFRIPGDVIADQWTIGDVDGSDCDRLLARGSAQFEALDPTTYGDTLHTDSTPRQQSGSGFTPPFTPPFTLGASVGGVAQIVNDGNTSGPWTGRLDGPLDGIMIEHLESGQRLDLSLTANGGLTLGAGDFVTLDSTERSVRLAGTADRRDRLTIDSQWWDLAPGTNSFLLTADSGSGILTVSGYDAFLS